MTTVQDLVDETRRHLHGGMQDRLNVLSGAVTSTTGSTVSLEDDIKGVGAGSILEVGLEQMYVRTANGSNNSAVVIRGHDRSVASTHAAGDIVRVNPSYSTFDIFLAVVDEIASLQGSGLYQFDTQEFSYQSSDKVYDLTLDTSQRTPLFVHGAAYERSQRYASWAPTRVELLKDLDEGDFPSTYGLKLVGTPRARTLYGHVTGGTLVRATVAFSLGTPSALDDDIADFGVTDVIKPIIPVGAAWRMLLGKEARRVNPDHSHGSRRAEEVQPGSISFLGRALQGMRGDLIENAVEQQVKRYPYRTDV